MQDICQKTVDGVVQALGAGFEVNEISAIPGFCAIETPFFYPDNSPITIYAKVEGDRITITDHGQVTENAIANGASDAAIFAGLRKVNARLGVATDDGELSVSGNYGEIGPELGALLSAIQSGGHIHIARKRTPQSQEFPLTVEGYLARKLWRFERDKSVAGKHRNFKAEYAVDRGPGVKQLLLFTFDPVPVATDNKLHRLYYEVTDFAEAQQDLDQKEKIPLRIIVNDDPARMKDDRYRRAVDEMRERLPNHFILWSEREQLAAA